jgi:UDP-N-acetylglucosamine 2-epimerase
MRDVTERPEAVLAGTAKLVGANFNNIVDSVNDLLDSPGAYESMSCRSNPYGDGAASIRIVEKIEAFLRGLK